MKKIAFIAFCFFCVSRLHAQTSIEVPSAFFIHKSTYNPALAGFDNRHVIDLSFRLSTYPIGSIADIRGSYEGVYKSNRFGILANAYSNHSVNEFRFCPMYNYRFELNENSYLALGAQFNYNHQTLSNPTNIQIANQLSSREYYSGDLGVVYRLHLFHAGLTARNVIANFDNRYYHFFGSYQFTIYKFTITPALIVYYSPEHFNRTWEEQIHSEITYNNILFFSFFIADDWDSGGALGFRIKDFVQLSIYHNLGYVFATTGLTAKFFLSKPKSQ